MSLSRTEVCPAVTSYRRPEAPSAASARRLLHSADTPDLSAFERELRRARLVAAQTSGRGTEDVERLELLAAVAGDLDAQLSRSGRGERSHPACLEANFRLLRHMAGAQRPLAW